MDVILLSEDQFKTHYSKFLQKSCLHLYPISNRYKVLHKNICTCSNCVDLHSFRFYGCCYLNAFRVGMVKEDGIDLYDCGWCFHKQR